MSRLCASTLPKPRSVGSGIASVTSVRLANAEREVLRIFLDALRHDDRKLFAEIERIDDTVDSLHRAIKLFLTR